MVAVQAGCPSTIFESASEAADKQEMTQADLMGGCQNYGPLLGTLNIRCRIMIRTHKGTIILTTTHIFIYPLQPLYTCSFHFLFHYPYITPI